MLHCNLFQKRNRKTNKRPPQFIFRLYNFKILHLKVLPFTLLAIYSLSKLQSISNILVGNKNPSQKSDLTCTVWRQLWKGISVYVCMCLHVYVYVHVCVCVRRRVNENIYIKSTRIRSQINNGLLTATLLPVICMQRSAEKVNVQKDTNSTIISRPENPLHYTQRH